MKLDTHKIGQYKYLLAIWTDHADFVDELTDEDKLLELRAFDESGEYRAWRDCVDEEFCVREWTAQAEALPGGLFLFDGYFDEAQYLDIDAQNSADTVMRAIGAGYYHLPEGLYKNGKKLLLVRYYYKFDEDGIAHKTDWRLCGFTDKEG